MSADMTLATEQEIIRDLYRYVMFKLYNKGGGKGSLEPYALYEFRG